MRYASIALLLTGCYASAPLSPSETASAPAIVSQPDLFPVVGSDMARQPASADMIESADMAPTSTQTAPISGPQLGSVCTAAQQCVLPEYGMGRCVVDVSGMGHCTTAIYFPATKSMNYCLSTNPSRCCLSTALDANQGVEVTGVFADWFTGAPTGEGFCDLGAFAPWVP